MIKSKYIKNLLQVPARWVDARLQGCAARLRRHRLKIAVIVGIPLLSIGYHQYSVNTAVHTATARVEAEAYGQFGVEVFTLATVLVGEAKGQPDEWPDMATAFLSRVDDPRWENSVERVAKHRCEIDALCDRVPEYLVSEIGQQAIQFAREVLTAYHDGEFVPTHTGHSWATPKAAEGHAYFEGLTVVAEGEGHMYFADAPTRPKPNPLRCGEQSLAPCTSIRPMPKPVPSTGHEQYRDEGIELAIAQALATATN